MSPDQTIDPVLLPFAPLLYIAWADGALEPQELERLRLELDTQQLDDAARAAVAAWLDPAAPPDAAALGALLRATQQLAGPGTALSLADLGVELARRSGQAAVPVAVLERLERVLGVAPADAVRALAGGPATESAAPAAAGSGFDPAALHLYLDGDHFETRQRVLALLSEPAFAYVADTDTAAYREQVMAWCRQLAARGWGAIAYPLEYGGEDDVARSIAVFETLAYHDLSLLVKYGVHFGLFGGSIYLLGTRTHHDRFLRAVATLELPGCFAMTETGHGSNVRDLETSAQYDRERESFIVHTPQPSARKDYIGNAALHARMAVVFAQLEVGGVRHGVHAFLVPLRDDHGRVLPGIRIEDCGRKEGLNGVDNGRIAFDRVRIPRDHLLDRYGSVSADGAYHSPIASAARRFFTMLGALVAGRISIACASASAAKSALTIAIRYADGRRQFGPEGRPEVPILDYRATQRALLLPLARTFALDFALRDLVRRFALPSEQDTQEIEALAAGLKAYASRHTVETLQACREACGGQGYLSENRLAALKADTDVFTTFEGANPVLLQLVARSLLTGYREQFGELRVWGVARYVASRAAAGVVERNPIATRRTDAEHLLDPEFHRSLFAQREARLLASLARRLKRRLDDGTDAFSAFNDCQDHALSLARAHVERVVLDRCLDGVAAATDRPYGAVLRRLAALYALAALEADRAWFLESGYFEPVKARAIRDRVNALLAEIRPDATALVAAFAIPDPLLAAPIGRAAS